MKRLLESLLGPGSRPPRWFSALAAAMLVLAGVFFWRAAVRHGDAVNLELTYNDQKVYMNMGAALKDSHYTYVIPRMRMPLYAVYTSLFYKTGTSVEDFYPIAKRANVLLSMLCVAALACGFRFWLGWGLAWAAALLSGFTWIVAKAAYVQPEVLLATLIGLSCGMLAELLRSPAWWKAVIAGMLVAGWHMTKASGPAILGIFFVAWTLKMLWPGPLSRKSLAVSAVILVGSFAAPIAPYCWQSVKIFGSPFYNTQSKYFVWCEDVDEKHAVQRMEVDVRPATAEEVARLPTAGKYLAAHSLGDMRKRIKKGYEGMMRNAVEQHAELFFALKLCACLLLLAIGLHPRKAWRLAKERAWEIAFVAGVIVAFALLFSWLQPIRVGPRMITSIHLVPLLFSLLWMREILRDETWKVGGMTLAADRVVVGLILLPTAAVLGWSVVQLQMPAHYFGG